MLLIPWLLTLTAWAAPQPVVAMGDGLVVGTEIPATGAQTKEGTVPGGWVAVLADCLEERRPGRFAVTDQSTPDATAKTARQRVYQALELRPALVLVGLGAQELSGPDPDRAGFRDELAALLADLRVDPVPAVMLVGMVPPTVAQMPDPEGMAQADVDQRTSRWNGELAALAESLPGVTHVDLLQEWPQKADRRGRLTIDGTHLSDQGHARVAAMVCDAVVIWDQASEDASGD
ncbi:MAG: SGNH/GDSL hydrolase family protein [Deltaproteobacteria bacterium]|nr:SGNH/GDSL hydrolase family protein [Deltaproteobacteria bacterium]